MYCRRCYGPLTPDGEQCPHCGRKFDPALPKTFLRRPFPRWRWVIVQIIGTTAVGVGVAWVVAMHQMSNQAMQWSGH